MRVHNKPVVTVETTCLQLYRESNYRSSVNPNNVTPSKQTSADAEKIFVKQSSLRGHRDDNSLPSSVQQAQKARETALEAAKAALESKSQTRELNLAHRSRREKEVSDVQQLLSYPHDPLRLSIIIKWLPCTICKRGICIFSTPNRLFPRSQ